MKTGSLSTADFAPACINEQQESRAPRPSRSYWQDSWHQLQKNRRAMVSLVTLILLLLMAAFGPLFWTVDPAWQDLEQISQTPGLGRNALIVADYSPWPGINKQPAVSGTHSMQAPEQLYLHGPATTEGVRLSWDTVPGASGYQIYRHEYPPTGINDLGLPMGETRSVSYEDRLGLETIRYYYSVVPMLGDVEESRYTVLPVDVKQALTLSDAVRRGLGRSCASCTRDIRTSLSIASDQNSTVLVGQQVRLPAHPLGTDYLGRDLLARIIHGARTSLFIGIGAPLVFILFGLSYGGMAGYLGGQLDNVLMRFADFVIALPFLLFMILLKVSFGIGPGESGIIPMLAAMVLLSWPGAARLVRGQVLQIREEAFVEAARLMGASAGYLIFRHLLPNVMGVVLVSLTFAIPGAIFTEAFLSFIGLGVVPPTPSWGSMCNDGLSSLLSHPHELIVPAVFISIAVLAFNLLGDGLRDALDIRMRGTQ